MSGCAWLLCVAVLTVIHASDLFPSVKQETVQVGRVQRIFHAQYPAGDAPAAGWPLVLSFHGWLSNALEMAAADKFRQCGARSAIVVHGEGYSDPLAPGWLPAHRWQSWNGGGSAGEEDSGVDGPICRPTAVQDGGWQCYASCKARGYCTGNGYGKDRCRWSHCEDDVAFALAIVKHLKEHTWVDASRVYATGHSNGGVFIYELASDPRTAGVFAAIAPVSGLPHNGFNRGTLNPRMRFLEIGGSHDDFVWHFPNVPGDGTKSYGTCCGWYYSNWRNTTALWASQKGLREEDRAQITSKQSGLTCQGWSPDGTAEGADVGVCFYEGGHLSPESVWKLAWDFFDLPDTRLREASLTSRVLVTFAAIAVVLMVISSVKWLVGAKRSKD